MHENFRAKIIISKESIGQILGKTNMVITNSVLTGKQKKL